jgi:hypothetical protein
VSRIQRAFLRGELGAGKPLQHLGHIQLFRRDHPQDGELEQSLAYRSEFFAQVHGLSYVLVLGSYLVM